MKKIITIIAYNILFGGLLLVMLLAMTLFTGCAHMGERSRAEHSRRHYAVVSPPGWTITTIQATNDPTGCVFVAVTSVTLDPTAASRRNNGFWANLSAPRPRVYCDWSETWIDHVSGGGTFLFTDPSASSLAFSHTNQTALGGSRSTTVGQIQSVVTTNDVAIVSAAGTAIGNVVGAAVNASTGGTTAVTGAAATAATK